MTSDLLFMLVILRTLASNYLTVGLLYSPLTIILNRIEELAVIPGYIDFTINVIEVSLTPDTFKR